jgi:hypothetical protein
MKDERHEAKKLRVRETKRRATKRAWKKRINRKDRQKFKEDE